MISCVFCRAIVAAVVVQVSFIVFIAAVPEAPESPSTRATASGLYMVAWDPPYDGGAPVLLYQLQARYVHRFW